MGRQIVYYSALQVANNQTLRTTDLEQKNIFTYRANECGATLANFCVHFPFYNVNEKKYFIISKANCNDIYHVKKYSFFVKLSLTEWNFDHCNI